MATHIARLLRVLLILTAPMCLRAVLVTMVKERSMRQQLVLTSIVPAVTRLVMQVRHPLMATWVIVPIYFIRALCVSLRVKLAIS